MQTALRVDLKNSLVQEERSRVLTKLNTLTPREKQLLTGIVQSKRTKQIASEMHISPNTAEVHRAQIMKKMGAQSIVNLITMIVKHDLMAVETA